MNTLLAICPMLICTMLPLRPKSGGSTVMKTQAYTL